MDKKQQNRQILTFKQVMALPKLASLNRRSLKQRIATTAAEHHARIIWNTLRENRIRQKVKARRKATAKTPYNTRQSIPEPTLVCVVPEFSDAAVHDVNAQAMIP